MVWDPLCCLVHCGVLVALARLWLRLQENLANNQVHNSYEGFVFISESLCLVCLVIISDMLCLSNSEGTSFVSEVYIPWVCLSLKRSSLEFLGCRGADGLCAAFCQTLDPIGSERSNWHFQMCSVSSTGLITALASIRLCSCCRSFIFQIFQTISWVHSGKREGEMWNKNSTTMFHGVWHVNSALVYHVNRENLWMFSDLLCTAFQAP